MRTCPSKLGPTERDTNTMSQGPITDVKALQGNKGTKWVLQVRGNVTIYANEKSVEIADLPDGLNPTIAMMSVTVTEDPGPMKGTPRPFVHERVVEPGKYRQVQINPDEDNGITLNILDVKTILD